MYEPTGAFAAEIIESMAQVATQQAEDLLRQNLTEALADRLKMKSQDLPASLISLLLQPVSARQERVLVDLLKVMGANLPALAISNPLIFADELADLAKNVRQSFRQKRNQASYIKTVLRPLHSIWLKRWRLEREDFDFERVFARADRLNSVLITNEAELEQWAREVLDFFQDTAVEPEGSRETSKRPRGTVSESGFRAYRLAWINFINENMHEILTSLHNDPARSKIKLTDQLSSISSAYGLAALTALGTPALALPEMAVKYMSPSKQAKLEKGTPSSAPQVPTSQIEVILQADDPATPRVARSWEFPAPDLLMQFQDWTRRLTPLLKLNDVPYNGTITARTPWGDQEVKLTNATASDIDNWGTMMIQP